METDLSNAEIYKQLCLLGQNPGPVTDSTRVLYLKKLKNASEASPACENSLSNGSLEENDSSVLSDEDQVEMDNKMTQTQSFTPNRNGISLVELTATPNTPLSADPQPLKATNTPITKSHLSSAAEKARSQSADRKQPMYKSIVYSSTSSYGESPHRPNRVAEQPQSAATSQFRQQQRSTSNAESAKRQISDQPNQTFSSFVNTPTNLHRRPLHPERTRDLSESYTPVFTSIKSAKSQNKESKKRECASYFMWIFAVVLLIAVLIFLNMEPSVPKKLVSFN